MGYIRHNAIIVTDNGYGDGIDKAHAEAVAIFTRRDVHEGNGKPYAGLVSQLISGVINGYRSFYVAPDGSKEGWVDSDRGDEARGELLAWLRTNREKLGWLDFVEVAGFGGDDHAAWIVAQSGTQEDEEPPS